MLWLQAKAAAMCVDPALAFERAVQEVARIELHARLHGPDLQHPSAARLRHPGREHELVVGLFFDDEGVPGSNNLWRQIAAGDIREEPFALNDAWVPWYNLHKIFAGLRDAWLYADQEQARDMLVKLSDWAAAVVSGLSDEQVQQMLGTEHGGMNEVFADVAAMTGEDRYLKLAERFSDRAILDPLLLIRSRELTSRRVVGGRG